MTDLPRGPRRPVPPGGLERALATGRRRLRRRRLASTAGTVSFAVVAGAALANGVEPRASQQHLDPAGTPSATTAPGRALPAPSLPVPTAVPTAVLPPPLGSPVPSPSATAAPAATPERGRYVGHASPDVAVATSNDPTACAAAGQAEVVARTGFCTSITGTTEVTPGRSATYAFTLCRAAGQAAKTLRFDDAQESLFHAYSTEGGPEWQSARTPARHTVTFAGGDCRTWTVTWLGEDANGYAFADGSYEMDGFAWAWEWVDEDGPETGPPPVWVALTVSS
jgi:hypothetical protein